MKRRLLTLLPNAFFFPLIATPISVQQGLNGALRYADESPAPGVRVLFFDPGDLRHTFTATTDQAGISPFPHFRISPPHSSTAPLHAPMCNGARPTTTAYSLGDITPSNPRIYAITLSSSHIATPTLPHLSIDENPLALTVEPRQTPRKKLPQTPASTWCPTARLL